MARFDVKYKLRYEGFLGFFDKIHETSVYISDRDCENESDLEDYMSQEVVLGLQENGMEPGFDVRIMDWVKLEEADE